MYLSQQLGLSRPLGSIVTEVHVPLASQRPEHINNSDFTNTVLHPKFNLPNYTLGGILNVPC